MALSSKDIEVDIIDEEEISENDVFTLVQLIANWIVRDIEKSMESAKNIAEKP